MTRPLVGPGISSTNPREFLDALVPSPLDRQLAQLADARRFMHPVERAPVTGLPPVVDLPALLRKNAAAGRFGGPERPAPRIGEGSRMDAIAALAGAVTESAYESTRPTSLAERPEARASARRPALEYTRAEFPPIDNSFDIRELRAQIKRSLYRLHPPRSNARKCGRVRFQHHVDIRVKDVDGHAWGVCGGVIHCASVWSCPTCAVRIMGLRADQVRAIMRAHREAVANEAVYMLTLTLPHGRKMKLKLLRRALAIAWQKVQRGKPWQRLRARMGFVGSITSREVTHGDQHGYHPHLHILIATSRVWTEEERNQFEIDLFIRWANAVLATEELDMECPSWEHGISLVPCHSEDYIQKLGLSEDLTGAPHKEARHGNRTFFQIAADYHRNGSKKDAAILRDSIRGMKGARQLTWSRGRDGSLDLRKRYAEALLNEPEQTALAMESDAELLTKDDARGVVVAEIPGRTWDAMVRTARRVGADAEYWIVTAAEYAGAIGVEAGIARMRLVAAELAKNDPVMRKWVPWLVPRDQLPNGDIVQQLQRRRVALARA